MSYFCGDIFQNHCLHMSACSQQPISQKPTSISDWSFTYLVHCILGWLELNDKERCVWNIERTKAYKYLPTKNKWCGFGIILWGEEQIPREFRGHKRNIRKSMLRAPVATSFGRKCPTIVYVTCYVDHNICATFYCGLFEDRKYDMRRSLKRCEWLLNNWLGLC